MTPAETPTECEACESFHHKGDDRSTWPEVFAEHHAHEAEKDARIRELEGVVSRFVRYVDVDTMRDPNGSKWMNLIDKARAALARSEGGSK